MSTSNLPAVIYHPLSQLVERAELEVALRAAAKSLHQGHISAIVNAFYANTQVSASGISYIKIRGVAPILRTGNSGAERPLIYRGIPGVIGSAEVIEIAGEEYISGPCLAGLLSARISLSDTKTRLYLEIAMGMYAKIANSPAVRDLRDLFLSNIEENRSRLKNTRISHYNITHCEFTMQPFSDPSSVEFAHIESVVSNPFKALDIDNGVIILKNIHRSLTRLGIHDFDGMYQYCIDHNLSTVWAS
jgi:hypothetical protein